MVANVMGARIRAVLLTACHPPPPLASSVEGMAVMELAALCLVSSAMPSGLGASVVPDSDLVDPMATDRLVMALFDQEGPPAGFGKSARSGCGSYPPKRSTGRLAPTQAQCSIQPVPT